METKCSARRSGIHSLCVENPLHGRGSKEIELAIAEMGNEGFDLAIEVSPAFTFSNTLHICKLNVILAFRLGHRFLFNRSLRTGLLLNLLRSSKPGACSQASAIESSLFSANCKTKMYLLFLFRLYFIQTVDRFRLLPSKRSLSEERRLFYQY